MNGRFHHCARCVGLIFLLLPAFATAQGPDYDFIISGAHLVDGTGAPWVEGDIAIAEEIVLNNDDGNPEPVPTRALEQLFKTMSGDIRLVVMNSCFSERQAKVIARFVDCVLGVKLALPDEAAVNFSPRFYWGLAAGKSVAAAYEIALISAYGRRLVKKQVPHLIEGKIPPENIILLNPYRKRKPDSRGRGRPTGQKDKVAKLPIAGSSSFWTDIDQQYKGFHRANR